MGRISDHVATMRGCRLSEIVDAIARMEAETLFTDMNGFDAFWQNWPHKVGKPVAKKAYAAAVKRGTPHSAIMDGVARYIHDKPPDRPWLNPSTFLNQERFNDQPAQLGHKPSPADAFGSLAEFYRAQAIGEGEDSRPIDGAVQDVPKLAYHRA